MRIFVGNLPFAATSDDVKKIFEPFGNVVTVSIQKKSGKNSRGFGFVTMMDEAQAQAAITALENKEFMGRSLSVVPELVKVKKAKVKKVVEPPIINEVVADKPLIKSKKINKTSRSGVWQKRKGTGTSKSWKKKPGGVKKKFKYERP